MTSKNSRPEEDNAHAQFIEPHTHSFIIKIWLIDHDTGVKEQNWRGYLTHVASGQRIYFTTLFEMASLLVPYLKEMGIKLPFWWRAYRWLTQ